MVDADITLFADFTVRHSATASFLAYGVIRQTGSSTLFADFTVRHSATATLLASLTPRFPSSNTLLAYCYIRQAWNLWTNRRFINSVIELEERSVDDGLLQLIIEGVMDDVKTFLLANDVGEDVYDTWTNIVEVPLIIRRATTYGVVAALYSRYTKSFRSRVITSVGPVNVTVKGDEQTAMEYWEDRFDVQLNRYLDTINADTITVSTEDEDAIFSMDDIPPTYSEGQSWHEWYNNNRAG